MTTQTNTTAPVEFSPEVFNEGLQFFLMNVRLNLGNAETALRDETNRAIPLSVRSSEFLNDVARLTLQLLDLSEERMRS